MLHQRTGVQGQAECSGGVHMVNKLARLLFFIKLRLPVSRIFTISKTGGGVGKGCVSGVMQL